MAVFGEVTFVRVAAQIYTGEAVVPNKNDIFVETYGMSGFADGTIITVTQLDEYAAREMTIECSNNIEPGTATINIIDPSGQFSVSGTFEIISNVLVNIMGLKHFKEKIENVVSETYATQNDVDKKIANLVNSAPETLDTLGEVAKAIKDNEDVVVALNSSIGNKADKDSLNNYLLKTGGTMEGDINLSTSKGFSATTTSGNVYDIFRVDSANRRLTVGGSYPALQLKGLNARPTYNGSEVALLSDVQTSDITIDTELSTTSTNAVQNSVITNELNKKVSYDVVYDVMTQKTPLGGTEEYSSGITVPNYSTSIDMELNKYFKLEISFYYEPSSGEKDPFCYVFDLKSRVYTYDGYKSAKVITLFADDDGTSPINVYALITSFTEGDTKITFTGKIKGCTITRIVGYY